MAVCLPLAGGVFAQKAEKKSADKEFEISKGISVFGAALRELDMFYVDSVDVEKVVRTGVEAMLESLDPYTTYYAEDMVGDLRLMATGEYAGIGAIISARDGGVIINEPYENMPAAKAGLQAGDRILAIDGVDMSKSTSAQVSDKLKGQAGTTLIIRVKRFGQKEPIDIKVVRENIHINSVPYYGVVGKNVGYIALNTFTNSSADEVKTAFQSLQKQGIRSLILDLRNNTGGVMESALQIVNMFVPKGKAILSTKGKMQQWDKTYHTVNEPLDATIPLVVLVNRSSASASEIVSGAVQDLDRGVVMGNRTYGKGLVQTTRELPYGGSIKVTTSKYYIPSGRCVQAIDYTHRNDDGSVGRIPDSLTSVFKTANGRLVRDGGGITPDIEMAEEKLSTVAYYLLSKYVIFDFASQWMAENAKPTDMHTFSLSDVDYNKFKLFVKEQKFTYDRLSEKAMQSLKEVMETEGYTQQASKELEALQAKLAPDIDRDLDIFRSEISRLIATEIARRTHYKRGEAIESLKTDKTVAKAVSVLHNADVYNGLLKPSKNGK